MARKKPSGSDSRKVHKLLLVSSGNDNATRQAARRLSERLELAGRFQLSAVSVTSNGVPAMASLEGSDFDSVALLVHEADKLSAAHVQALTKFVQAGGGLVVCQGALMLAQEQSDLGRLLGAQVEGRMPSAFDYQVQLDAKANAEGHAIAGRVDGYVVRDQFVQLKLEDDATVFARSHLSGRPMPMGYERSVGKGKVVCLAHGGAAESLLNRNVERLFERALRYVGGETYKTTVRAGILGYGGAFNMGKRHAEAINAQHGMQTVAVCDLDPRRTEQAKGEIGEKIRTYNKPEQLIADDKVDMIVGILPHNLHAEYCIAASKAGKHAVTEKPFSITLDEADQMIAAARESNTMLSCFHNRRWDGDFQQLLTVVRNGEIGDVFHIDAATGGYNMPRDWWRASKAMSGGVLYDWGAHYVDWLLNLMPKRIASVSGNLQKRYWHNTTNEDFAQVHIRFEDDTTATLEQGDIVAVRRHGWRILGTTGGLSNAKAGGEITMVKQDAGIRRESSLTPWPSRWDNYYQNIANHLIMSEPLIVTAEQARRVSGVLHLAEQSSNEGGKPMPLPGEAEFTPDYRFPW
ncbi:Gfo/Idh/MocA family oxidoreductase [Phycisphaerales bacterium AB-hyl4]|uniref:Gfo/Idh/MocA family oxidoreductase n=1 Tax=Natronomicrosphaera hydrolytica TaxID=3242702 RepID=A0ABV4U329_9BACT